LLLNKQKKSEKKRGIEWTDYTWNPIGGCFHGCRWDMPDGKEAICYAENHAESEQMKPFYPEGFEHHYWHPNRLIEPLGEMKPARIFVGSMADIMGHWVPGDQIQSVIETMRQTPKHTYQVLTKAAPRLLDFEFPENAWLGVSAPPSTMMGKRLSEYQQIRMVLRQLDVLQQLKGKNIRWMSIEPLSFDISELFVKHEASKSLDWIVIGAASNGRTFYQPKPEWVADLLAWADWHGVPVFFKGNLEWPVRREEFPT
jgi:protein gp37